MLGFDWSAARQRCLAAVVERHGPDGENDLLRAFDSLALAIVNHRGCPDCQRWSRAPHRVSMAVGLRPESTKCAYSLGRTVLDAAQRCATVKAPTLTDVQLWKLIDHTLADALAIHLEKDGGQVDDDNMIVFTTRQPAVGVAAAPGRAPNDDDDDDDTDGRRGASRHSADESFEAPKSRGGLGVIAGIGLSALVVAGVLFGVPQIRERILGGSGDDAPADIQPGAAVTRPELAAAQAATNSLGMSALAQAEAGLQRAIDTGDADPATQAALKVALAELLLNRALAYQIAAAIDEARRDDFRKRASDDRKDGERLIDGLEGFSDVDRLAQVRALARLAAGRAEVEVGPMVPAGASETKLIVRGAVLWQDLAASVPEGLVAGLQGLSQPSGLGQSTLALALLRAGDTTAAYNTAERLMVAVGSDEQIVAQAIRTKLGLEQGAVPEIGETGETEGEPEEAGEEGRIAKLPPPPGRGGGNSLERLIERGCEQVASGDADAGIKTLQLAFDENPNDLDVLVCLADGYAAQGSNQYANQFYERALEQSPNHKGALRGAAKSAAKSGSTERAIDLYERLLKVDPNNAVALAYLANNKPGGAESIELGPVPGPVRGG
jgi:tetratricopeptide (TPR) repeat protein